MAKGFTTNIPKGIQTFSSFFAEHSERYVLIGGTAVLLHHESRDLKSPRSTEDLDVVILDLEEGAKNSQFLPLFQTFIQAHGYECEELSDGKAQAFRFSKPKTPAMPSIIEIASKAFQNSGVFQPVRKLQDSSLSTMVFEEPFYSLIKTSKTQLELDALGGGNVPTVTVGCLIALKLYAYKNLREKEDPKHKKHFKDLCRLTAISTEGDQISVVQEIIDLIPVLKISEYATDDVETTLMNCGWPKKSTLDHLIAKLETAFTATA